MDNLVTFGVPLTFMLSALFGFAKAALKDQTIQ